MAASLSLRSVPLDGAVLLFDHRTGLNVRVDNPATRNARRRAPRTVNFALSSACNLACSFCFRDHAASTWSVDSAHALLVDLERHGVLEVAFGGGEPLAWKGFDQLLERLHADTRLALNITTNGTLLTEERARRLAPFVSEVRVSRYPQTPWDLAVTQLIDAGVRTGVNVLVDRTVLPRLDEVLGHCLELGCVDVALLRYVGPEATFTLSLEEEASLERIVNRAPLPLRLSTCFADRLPRVPRLFDGDCGAGDEFIVVTPDRRVRGCSFQPGGEPFETADDLLAHWQARRELRTRAPGLGCGRTQGRALSDGIRLWRTFSSNNSAECVLVGRFETSAEARHFVDFLQPLLVPGEEFPPNFVAQLLAHGVTAAPREQAPEAMEASGPVVLMDTHTTLQDFRSLETLLWHEGGQLLRAGHVHENPTLISAIRPPTGHSARELEAELSSPGRTVVSKSQTVFVTHDWDEFQTLRQYGELTTELIDGVPDLAKSLPLAVRQRRPRQEGGWLFAIFPNAEAAQAARLPGATVIGRWAVRRTDRINPRDGFLAHSRGGRALAIPGESLELVFFVSGNSHHGVEAVCSDLKVELGPEARPTFRPGSLAGRLVTDDPATRLKVLDQFARGRELSLYATARPIHDLARLVARLEADLPRR